MAAGLGFKDFTTGEVLTAGDVDGYLMQGIWVFASAAARDAAVTSPQEGNACYLKDTNEVLTYSGSAWAAVGGGGGGKLLQVVQGSYSTPTTITTTTMTDTGLSLSITPTSATSKILVLVNQLWLFEKTTNEQGTAMRILRGATEVFTTGSVNTAGYLYLTTTTGIATGGVVALSYLDSPATTSATTYKTQGRLQVASGSLYYQSNSGTSIITLMEIGA
jgi:hypothetical protein